MTRTQTALFTLLAMLAFAGNSLLCRIALKHTAIDAASFTSIRIVSGALVLWLAVRLRGGAASRTASGSWPSALALYSYAIFFSFAYVSLPAGTGALLAFSAVQASMISHGLWNGERLRSRQWLGLLLALGGLVSLLLPGIAAPPLGGAALMIVAGISWGVYSLRGRRAGDATQATAGNFMRAVPLALGLSLLWIPSASIGRDGALYAIASGTITSGAGYVIWYTALKGLKSTDAAVVQLSVPVIALIGGVLLLGEPLLLRGVAASITILGGIALVILGKKA